MENIRVVIVEDDTDIRQSFEMIIDSAEGFECIKTFDNAEDAVEGIPGLNPDVVIMDIHLPGMTGIDAVRILKAEMPALQIAMCTVYEDDEHIFNALRAGASGYLLKRTTPEKLLEAVSDLNQGGSPMSSEIARRVVASFQKPAPASAEIASLTAREKEILDLLAKGYLYKEIAATLFISIETVKRHIHNIYEKLHVQTRTEALNKVFKLHG
ncbi:MAG: response regulator transcription factor [Saprospiraceae bacterium]|nr:response regulator transcription factor [Saprospiraceae bacterium]